MARLHAALVRHARFEKPADTPSAHLPYPLTEKGVRQAGELADTLRRLAGDLQSVIHPVIDTSSLLRAWQTATLAASRLADDGLPGVTVEQFDALMERCLGSAANLGRSTIQRLVEADPRLEPLPDDWKVAPDFRPPFVGAESLTEAGRRVADHVRGRMEHLARNAVNDTLKVFVGHSSAMTHAARHLGVLTPDDARRLAFAHGRPVVLRYEGGTFTHVAGDLKRRKGSEDPD